MKPKLKKSCILMITFIYENFRELAQTWLGGPYFLLIWSSKCFCTIFQNISYFLTIMSMSTEKIRHLSLKMSPGEQNMYKSYFPDFLQYLTCWEISLCEKLDFWTLNRHKNISDEDSTVNLFVNSILTLNLKSHEVWW
jgi:hypothetical protein